MRKTDSVQFQLLGDFTVTVNGTCHDRLAVKSGKGISVLIYLILKRGQPVSSQRMIRECGARRGIDPENAMKTLISRLRALLNSLSPGLGACVCSERGAYRWQSLPGVQVDVLELLELCEQLRRGKADWAAQQRMYRRVLALYQGDLFQAGYLDSAMQEASFLHRLYLETVHSYVEQLRKREEYNEIEQVCRAALRHDELDETLGIELMRAMVSLNRAEEAAAEYRRVTHLSRRYLDEDPSEDMQACYQELIEASRLVQFNLDAIRNELLQQDSGRQGPFFCDYAAFCEIYNIQMRNLERLGSTMFLSVIMISGTEGELSAVSRESCMAGLQEILRKNLRKGDIVTRFSPEMFAMLLPTVNYGTGAVVMERIETLFYQEYSNRSITIHHRISPLGGYQEGERKLIS